MGAYQFFMAGTKLPVTPGSMKISIPSRNETVTLIDDGDINILKQKGLKEFEFEIYLPAVKYPFADFTSGYEKNRLERTEIIPPAQYLDIFQKLKDDKLPFQLDIYRSLPYGNSWATNETVAIEDYDVIEDTDNGYDVVVNMSLKQYKYYATQKVVLSEDGLTYTTVRDTTKKYNRIIQCREGDTLTTVARREFGYSDVPLIMKLFELNKDTITASNAELPGFRTTLHAGMTLRLTEV